MSKLTETLKDAGWVETTLGECRLGEEVLLTQAYFIPRGVRVTKTKDRAGYVRTSDGDAWIHDVTVLRAPREGWEDIDDPNEVPKGVAA